MKLMDAVVEYNEKNGTDFNPVGSYFNYERNRKKQVQ